MSLKARLAKLEQHYPIAADDLSAMTDLELDAQIERLYGLLAPAERKEADRLLAAKGIYLTGGGAWKVPGSTA